MSSPDTPTPAASTGLPTDPALFTRAEWGAVVMCVGAAGGQLAEDLARGETAMIASYRMALLARDALKRVLGEELMGSMIAEDIPRAMGVDHKDIA